MSEELKTLRDEFAVMALDALLKKPIVAADRNGALKAIGLDAYKIADAMMAARGAPKASNRG